MNVSANRNYSIIFLNHTRVNMTTKYKIISGFFVMMLLLAGIAFLGYTGSQDSSDRFQEYRRQSSLNVFLSDLGTAIASAAYNVQRFKNERNPAYADQARKEIGIALAKVQESQPLISTRERATMLADINKDLLAFRETTNTLQQHTLDAYRQYSDVVQPLTRDTMLQALKSLASQARERNNTEALYGITEVWDDFSSTRSSVSRFSESGTLKDADRARGTLSDAQKAMTALGSLLQTNEGRKLYDVLAQSFSQLNDAFVIMDKMYKAAAKDVETMDSLLKRLINTRDKLNAEVDTQMTASGEAMLKANAESQQQMLMTSVAGLVIGLAFALFIIYGLIRVLSQVSGFAGAVSKGDFAFKLDIREKGEIGGMVDAMRQIPAVLEKVTLQANTLASAILSGRFRDRLNSTEFSGSFGNLTQAVNTVSNAYTGVLDSMPVPIVSCDKSDTIMFLNKSSQDTIGGNHTQTKYENHFKAAAASNDQSFGKKAMDSNKLYIGETTIMPQGKRMDASVTAIPLHDAQNAIVGYLEIITDLTEIKTKQATMLSVAHDASAISDRVAAASEELAAQVEQISRGAEIQRSRMESTASAMTEMNATVLEVARNASQASEQSEGTKQKAEQGAHLVNEVVNSINAVNTVATTLQDNMQKLGKLAEGIGGVMNVISDIADQTNLLALNAAIEAARAGEAGRGFAVVADEVRKLAEKTMSATHEVGSSITSIQQSARSNIEEVGSAVTSITTATDLANSSGKALQEIVDLAAANSSVVASIATAAEEQSATSEEINRSIEEINHIVADTTDGMVQSSAAVQDLSRMAQELRRVMDNLK